MNAIEPGLLTCPVCTQVHRPVRLRAGERALCSTCGTTLARRTLSEDGALAFTFTALLLAVPAFQMPLVVVRKFGAEHASYLWTGATALWRNGMPLLSVWVVVCGLVVPLLLLGTLSVCVMSRRFGARKGPGEFWTRSAHALEHWSMPEVHVLAVLVAFVKIGVLVQVDPGPGLWCYAGMTVATLFAWRSTQLRETGS